MLSTVVSQRYRGELSLLAQAAVAAIAVTTLAVLASPAGAQSPRPKAAAPAKAAPAALQSQGPLIAVVSTGSQRVTFYDRNGVVVSSPVSTGRSGFETPHGVFSIIERKEEHFSNIYDDAPMPFMQRITWSGVALHAGSLPGYPASHGCIRLPHSFAERLFKLTKINTRVIIVGRDAAPMPIVHAALFQPRLPDATPVAVAPVEGPSAPPPQTRQPLPFNPVDGAEAQDEQSGARTSRLSLSPAGRHGLSGQPGMGY